MQTVKLRIQGSFYDSQIYSKILYLWSADGTIITVDWDQLIDHLIETLDGTLKFVAYCSLRNNAFFYDSYNKLLLSDAKVLSTLETRFTELNGKALEIDENLLELHQKSLRDNPFVFPHSDTLLFHNKLFVGSGLGVEVSKSSSITAQRHQIDKPEQVWDGMTQSLAGANYTVAMALGHDGIAEYNWADPENKRAEQTVEIESSKVRWMYDSLYSSSYSESHFLYFKRQSASKRPSREPLSPLEVSSADQLFADSNIPSKEIAFSWGARDKICTIHGQTLHILKYTFLQADERPKFAQLSPVNLEGALDNDIVTADSTVFGYVIETDNNLIVVDSSQETTIIPGEPVNWRLFPNTKYYTNHLHVVYDDYMDIYVFSEDYLVNQEQKNIGIVYEQQ